MDVSMSRTRYKFLPDDPCPYFVTATAVNWLPVCSNPNIAGIVIDSMNFLVRSGRMTIYAYVLMENHLHMVSYAEDLSKEIAELKSYTARKSINYYLECNNQWMLNQLAFHKKIHKTDRTYQFWQEGSHPERIYNEDMLRQKIEYIHQNAVKRGYVDKPEHWRYSSARDYAEVDGLVEVVLGV